MSAYCPFVQAKMLNRDPDESTEKAIAENILDWLKPNPNENRRRNGRQRERASLTCFTSGMTLDSSRREVDPHGVTEYMGYQRREDRSWLSAHGHFLLNMLEADDLATVGNGKRDRRGQHTCTEEEVRRKPAKEGGVSQLKYFRQLVRCPFGVCNVPESGAEKPAYSSLRSHVWQLGHPRRSACMCRKRDVRGLNISLLLSCGPYQDRGRWEADRYQTTTACRIPNSPLTACPIAKQRVSPSERPIPP